MEHHPPSRPPSATLDAVAALATGDASDPRRELAARLLTEHNRRPHASSEVLRGALLGALVGVLIATLRTHGATMAAAVTMAYCVAAMAAGWWVGGLAVSRR